MSVELQAQIKYIRCVLCLKFVCVFFVTSTGFLVVVRFLFSWV